MFMFYRHCWQDVTETKAQALPEVLMWTNRKVEFENTALWRSSCSSRVEVQEPSNKNDFQQKVHVVSRNEVVSTKAKANQIEPLLL